MSCTSDQVDAKTVADCTGLGPAGEAGVRPGDKILAIDGQEMRTFVEIREYVLTRPGQTVTLDVERAGERMLIDVPVASVARLTPEGTAFEAGAIGVSNAPVEDAVKRFGPVEAVPATARTSGEMLSASVKGIIAFPGKVPGVVASIFGAERDVEGPISVVGASRAGGELVERSMWTVFFFLLVSLNFFLALFNLIPLPPLDGGHIAVVLYEAIRDRLRAMRGLPQGGPVNYQKLAPVTYTMAALLLGVGVLVIIADVVNPVRLFG